MNFNEMLPLLLDTTKSRNRILTISELTRRIRGSLEQEFFNLWVVGEASNVRRPTSGHVYLTLKDADAQLQAVIFKTVVNNIKFEVRDGMEVLAFGSVTVYEARGQYQLIIERIEPKGIGALQLAFLQLKERLEKEGLFDPAHKKPLPLLPKKIAIVTSLTGAAIRDILNVINRRFAKVEILIYPVKVQGDGAAQEIAQAITDLNAIADIDVIIAGRGGGSLEDLWAFNEEVVARSIYASKIPVISAVGHEIDVTISDLVADKRALTPTEAGELVVPRYDQVKDSLEKIKTRLIQALYNKILLTRTRLLRIKNSFLFKRPFDKIFRLQQELDELAQRLVTAGRHTLELERERLTALASRLESVSPLKVLNRGYSITTNGENDKPIKSTEGLTVGQRLKTRFFTGGIVSSVVEILK
ncbi:MAG: exodeoxyribonuclease VII large subunit [Candidatus Brocadia sp. AMX2]|uniref:Exodeoxyribonuclease 7 large subunit n=1 Tax=Candidatus Brocadia sinica JPN1 TaxID=1197129 RepID=A0ABQ0JU71_9BACT|nr:MULTISPECIES: exodeoxyribonuclease VII large subunit [Brocadia]KXK31363.1 MAG: exodeoxyribonuclease VII large subunit [Candidatus Brocadia sinica]MBC6933240.1 exodeoxyribonuclease VII large subunit [Candidatus Brocadia sp.]MBL1168925.1 exodeoxyribonuclease VII large subunit [Candidatus Brocadia sp. AMX1]NOG41878.1 exodeoxyribonuclease VII large subunit [Planctomycetota bacterium]KAA0241780.1 MAG: exodeoxyribonuclease VII large subunit [Candidatus Brocadia sp. AMX2]